MIYLFSSASRDQYLQDALNVLALPNSAIYRFRYDVKYATQELCKRADQTLEQYEQSLQGYVGQDALIVFVDQQIQPNTTISDDTTHFYPLRRAKIKRLFPEGNILYVYFALANYVDLGEQVQQLENRERLEERIKTELQNQCPPHKYISVKSDLLQGLTFAHPEYDADAWTSIVSSIDETVLKNTIFYRITGLRRLSEPFKVLERFTPLNNLPRKGKNIPIQEVLPGESGYVLKSKQIYAMDLSFYHSQNMAKSLEQAEILTLLDKTYFTFLPDTIEVLFRYDKRTVELVTTSINRDVFTRIGFSAQKTNKDASQSQSQARVSQVYAPKISFMLKLTYPKFVLLVAFILLLIAQLMVAAPGIFTSLPLTNALSQDAIKVFGSAMTAFILFLLFRRLPGAGAST